MKKTLLLILLAGSMFSMDAQSRREERMKERNHEGSLSLLSDEGDDADFKNYHIADSFKKAPAVIVCQTLKYIYPDNGVMNYTKNFHRKIVLNEKSAIEEFSTLYLDLDFKQGGAKADKIAIRVIKPGGKENVITGRDARLVDKGNVPKIYQTSWGNYDEKYYKMAMLIILK